MGKADVFVSVVAVCRDQAGVLPAFVREVSAVLDEHYANYEILLLDNSSTDATAATVRGLLGSARCVRYLQLSRQAPAPDKALPLCRVVATGQPNAGVAA